MKMPTEILREEHRVILLALDTLEAAARRTTDGRPLDDGWWTGLIEWLRAFADRSHHAKEERSLFPAMEKAGVPREGGPIGVMLEEHARGRAIVQAMADAVPAGRPALAREFVRLLRQHIDKENGVLFPMADAVLDDPAQQGLRREFAAVEAEQGPAAGSAHAESLLAGLACALA